MSHPPRWLIVPGLAVLLFLIAPGKAVGQGSTAAALRVSARVAPLCSVITDSPIDGAANPSVRVVCAGSSLSALRVSADAGRGEDVMTVASFGLRRRAGGEIVVSVPQVLATLAGGRSTTARPRAAESGAIVVTLHF